MAAPAKLLYEDVSDDSVRSRAEAAASLRASCSPPPGGGCGLPIPFGIDAVRPAATRAFLGPKPAKRTHACQSCGLLRYYATFRGAACEGCTRAIRELRAFAAESCGPPRSRANRFSGRSLRSARVDRCGPPLREASARRTDVRFMFRTQLAKHTQRAAAARQWLRHRNRARRPNTLFRTATALFDSATTDSEEYLLHLSVETNR